MSRKRLKQYLTLLLAIGVIAAIAGGTGTFASFNATVANPSNTFATGTLVLNDNGGTTTCTSAVNNTNDNSAGTDCDTLFDVDQFTAASTTLTAQATGGPLTQITVGAISNGPIYAGDKLQLDNGTDQETVTVSGGPYDAAGAITVSSVTLSHTYDSGAIVTDLNPTMFANLTLTNAGTLDAGGISYKGAGCTSSYGGPTAGNLAMGTVTAGASSTTTLTVSGLTPTTAFKTGDTVVVSEGTHHQAFVATADTNSATSISVTAQNWNFAYTTAATIRGVQFNGATAQDLCNDLELSATETTGTFATDLSSAAGCAIGGTTSPEATNACDFGDGVNLKNGLPSQYTDLTLKSDGGSGNTGGELDNGGSRYFLLAVHYVGTAFDNSYQNTTGTGFGLTWRIDQK